MNAHGAGWVRYKWELLALLWLAFFLNQADRQVYSVVLKSIQGELHLSDAQLGLIASVLFWTLGLLFPVAGYVGDVFSKKWIITFSLLFWSMARAGLEAVAPKRRLNWREMILAVFRGEVPQRVVWQPRLEYWFWVHQKQGTLPKRYEGATLLDLYDDLGCSVRYFVEPLRVRYDKVQVSEERDGDRLTRTWRTPVGELREVLRYNWFGISSQVKQHKVKTPKDLRVLEYIREDALYAFDLAHYEAAVARVGDRGVPQFYYQRSPLQSLIIEDMGFEATVYALADCRDVVEHFLEVATRADDRMYEVLLSSPAPILNLGENTDFSLNSPSMLKRYLLPYYRMRTAQIKAAGKFCHIHMDGCLKPILPFLHEAAWNGIESPTPLPQGDVALEQLKEAMGELVLLDGIPALYFLPEYSEAEVVECAKKIVRLFHPHLILGISGSLPPEGDVEKVRLVSRLLQEGSL